MKSTRKQALALTVVALLLVTDALLRQHNGDGWDFNCYYTAGKRLLHGETLYVATDAKPFKYPPLVALYFVPYGLLPYEAARWLWAVVHALLCLGAPLLVWRVVGRDASFRDEATVDRFVSAVCVAFIGTFRFVDSELMVSQITLGAYLMLPLAAWLATTLRGASLAPAALVLGSAVKVHSLACLLSLAPERSKKTALSLLVALALLVFLPHPRLWLAWWEQIRVTTAIIGIDSGSFNLQGFYPFGVLFLELPRLSILPALAALPFAAVAWLRLPRFTTEEVAVSPARFLLAASSWFLLGVLASPLPWQYTYAILWPLFTLSWLVGNRRQRGFLLGLALFLGLTPKGLAGVTVMTFIEGRQLIFAAVLAYWVLLWWQAAKPLREKPPKESVIYVPSAIRGT